MVLHSLGEKILKSLSQLTSAKTVDDDFFKSFLSGIVAALREADVSNEIVIEFFKSIRSKVKISELPNGISAKRFIEKEILSHLVKIIDPKVEPFKPVHRQTNVFMMVGLQGAGKTTTCAKLGLFYKKKGFKVGLIAADTFRAGAREQLMQNAQSVDLNYYVDYTESDPVKVAKVGIEKFKSSGFEVIIVDTSGKNSQQDDLFNEMKEMEDAIQPDSVVFVLDGTIGQAALAQAKAFKEAVDVGSIIITKLDSDAKGGGALSAVAATGCPISFYGTGEAMHALEIFNPQSFISRMLGYGDLTGLLSKFEDIDRDTQQHIMDRLMSGKLGFKDMYEYYRMIDGLGPMSNIMEMMGMKNLMPQMGGEQMQEMIKHTMVVIESMSKQELENPTLFYEKNSNRFKRLAKGTGLKIEYIQRIVEQQRILSRAFSRLPKDAARQMNALFSKGAGAVSERELKKGMDRMINKMTGMNPSALNRAIKNLGGNLPQGLLGGLSDFK